MTLVNLSPVGFDGGLDPVILVQLGCLYVASCLYLFIERMVLSL